MGGSPRGRSGVDCGANSALGPRGREMVYGRTLGNQGCGTQANSQKERFFGPGPQNDKVATLGRREAASPLRAQRRRNWPVTKRQRCTAGRLFAPTPDASFDENFPGSSVPYGTGYRRSAAPRCRKEGFRPAPEGRQPSLPAHRRHPDPADRRQPRHAGRDAVHGLQHDDQPAEAEVQGERRAGYGLRRGRPGPLPRQRLPAARQRGHGPARHSHQNSHHRTN